MTIRQRKQRLIRYLYEKNITYFLMDAATLAVAIYVTVAILNALTFRF